METFTIFTIFLLANFQGLVFSTEKCYVKDDSLGKHQEMFRKIIQDNNNKAIFIYLEIYGIHEIASDDLERNRMAEWIWVTQDYEHFLRYPLDIDLYTFGLLQKGTAKFHLQIEIENLIQCKKSYHTNFLYEYLTKIVNGTGEGRICHRYFEDQESKLLWFNISHVSIGYDFECFQDKLNVSKREIVTKSPIIYIIIVIVVIFISFYPAIISIALRDEKEHVHVEFYTKADYPFTFRRFILYTLFHNTSHSFISVFRFTFLILLWGFVFFCMKLIAMSVCDSCLPTDKRKYPKVYDLTTAGEEDIQSVIAMSLIFLFVLHILNFSAFSHSNTEDHIILFDITNMFISSENEQKGLNVKLLRFIPTHYCMCDDENTDGVFSQIVWRYKQLGSLYFWSKIFLFPMRYYTKIKRMKCKFLYVVVNLIVVFPINIIIFTSCTLCPLINFLYLQTMKYFEKLYGSIFELFRRIFERIFSYDFGDFGRIYSDFPEEHQMVFIVSRILFFVIFTFYPWLFVYFLYLYFVENCFSYGLLYFLQTFIYTLFVGMPHLLSTRIHVFAILILGITYVLYFIISFYGKYRKILLFILDIKGTSEISVDHFEKVINVFFPLRNAVFVLIAKSFFTILLSIFIYITFGYVHLLDERRDNDFNILFPIIASSLAPWIIEKYCLESIEDHLHRKEKHIKKLLDSLRPENNLDISTQINELNNTDTDLRITIEQLEFEMLYVFPCLLCEEDTAEEERMESLKNKKYSQAFCDEIFESRLCEICLIHCCNTDKVFCEECCACIICEEDTEENKSSNCQVFSDEICACLPFNCINTETKQCVCGYTLVEKRRLLGYKNLSFNSIDPIEDELRNEHIISEENKEETNVKSPHIYSPSMDRQ